MPVLRLFAIILSASLAPAAAFAAGPAGALERAAERGDQTVVRSLIQQGADVNAPGVDGSTPLHRAVFADHLDVASMLVKAGARVSAVDRYGVTPIALASINCNAKMLRL